MVKNFSLLLLLAVLSSALFAQDRTPVELKNSQLYINVLDPGIYWEKRIADAQSVVLGFGLTTIGDENTDPFDDDLGFSLNPILSGEFRNFYPRKRVKKDLNPNSGNYVAVRSGYYFGALADNLDSGTTETSDSFFIGPVWGIQRNYKSGLHFGLSLGGGIAVGSHTDLKFTGIGQLQLGFAIGK